MNKYILGIGGANYDLHVNSEDRLRLHDSNPAKFENSAGGVGRNIIENLARLGNTCRYLSAFGSDAFGEAVRDSLHNASVNTEGSYISSDYPTSSYLSVLDKNGDMYIAACDCRILENAPASWILENEAVLRGCKALVIDANLNGEQIAEITKLAQGIRIYADPVSCAKAKRLVPFLSSIYFIKPNRMELSELSGMPCETNSQIEKACEKLLSLGVCKVAVSLGEDGCYFASNSGECFYKNAQRVEKMINANGAGDAFTAGFVHADLKGMSAEDAISFALKCGSLAIMSNLTVNPEIEKLR